MPSGYFSNVDPFGFSAFLSAGNFFSTGLSIQGHPATGNLWADLPRSTYAKLQGGKKLIINSRTLTVQNAGTFANFFKSRSSAAQIPWILGPASLIPGVGTVITLMTSTLDGLQRLGQQSVDSDQLAALMADGGVFFQTLAEESSSRLTVTTFYQVKVGNEGRMYGICSSTYGLNVTG